MKSLAFPVIGTGSGGFNTVEAERVMMEALLETGSSIEMTVVRYGRKG